MKRTSLPLLKRRDFIKNLLAPLRGRLRRVDKRSDRKRRVALLLGIGENDEEARSRVRTFQQSLRDLGWSEGRNIHIEYRFAGSDPDRIKEHVAELVTLAPDVFVANSTPVLAALRQATSSIPIVFAVVNEPSWSGICL